MKRIRLCLVIVLVLACFGQVSAQDRTYDHFFLEAMVQRQKGNNDAAFDLLRHCVELNPEAAEAWYFLAQYYNALKDQEKSQACIQKAALYQQVEDFDQAIGVLNKIEKIDGKNERISMAKSEIYNRKGDKKAAIAEMKALAQQFPNDQNYQAMYGEALMMNGQVKKALKVYDDILKSEPDNNRVLMSLRTYHQALGHQTEADSLTERVLLNRNSTVEEKIHLLRQEISASEQAGGDSTKVLGLFRRMLAQPQSDEHMALFC